MKNCCRVELEVHTVGQEEKKRKKSNFQKISFKFLTVDPIEVTMYHEVSTAVVHTCCICLDLMDPWKLLGSDTHLHFIECVSM